MFKAPSGLADQNTAFARMLWVLLRYKMKGFGHPWTLVEQGYLNLCTTKEAVTGSGFAGSSSSWLKNAMINSPEETLWAIGGTFITMIEHLASEVAQNRQHIAKKLHDWLESDASQNSPMHPYVRHFLMGAPASEVERLAWWLQVELIDTRLWLQQAKDAVARLSMSPFAAMIWVMASVKKGVDCSMGWAAALMSTDVLAVRHEAMATTGEMWTLSESIDPEQVQEDRIRQEKARPKESLQAWNRRSSDWVLTKRVPKKEQVQEKKEFKKEFKKEQGQEGPPRVYARDLRAQMKQHIAKHGSKEQLIEAVDFCVYFATGNKCGGTKVKGGCSHMRDDGKKVMHHRCLTPCKAKHGLMKCNAWKKKKN